jgi:hypothetical protein
LFLCWFFWFAIHQFVQFDHMICVVSQRLLFV